MMKIIFLLIAVFFSFQILRREGVVRLQWFFAGFLFFPNQIVLNDSPTITFSRLMIYMLFIAHVIDYKNWLPRFLEFKLAKPLLLIFASLLLIGIFDDRLSLFLRVYRPVTYFVENFFIIYLSYSLINSIEDVRKLFSTLLIYFFIYALYGVYNFITISSPYHDLIFNTYGGIRYADISLLEVLGNRSRIPSFSDHSFVYSLYLAVILLYFLFYYINFNYSPRVKIYLLLLAPLLFLNLFLTNTRTAVIAFLLGFIFYFIVGLRTKIRGQLLIICIAISALLYLILPNSFSILEQTIKTFSSSGADVGGSSIDMRLVQLDASFELFNDNPIFGNGMNYISEGLGYSADAEQRTSMRDLQGFESYLFKLLIEQGVLGILSNFAFFYALVMLLVGSYLQCDNFGRQLVVLGLSSLISFMVFVLGTGDLGTFMFFLALMGVLIKATELSYEPIVEVNRYG